MYGGEIVRLGELQGQSHHRSSGGRRIEVRAVEEPAPGDGTEGHAEDELRVHGRAGTPEEIGEAPVAREIAHAVVLEVRGGSNDEFIAAPGGEVAGVPAALGYGAAVSLQALEEVPAQEGIVVGSEERIPGGAVDLREILDRPQLEGLWFGVCHGGGGKRGGEAAAGSGPCQ